MAADKSPAATLVGEGSPELEKVDEKAPNDVAPATGDLAAEQPLHADTFPHGLKLFLLIVALELNVFIIALDQTIIAPATPVLSNEFSALADIGWYTSAYLMTTTAMQPLYGRLFGLLNVKWTYLSTIIIFEIGSLICATAHSSPQFIVGRAIAGTGLAGGYIGTMIIISMSAPLEKVPLYTSLIGMAYGGGAVVGPIIGGALTSELPIGGLTAALAVLFLRVPPRPHNPNLRRDLMRLDIVGTGLLLAAVTCFLLVCQYGGLKDGWAWGDANTIGLIVGAVAIGAAFVAWEFYWGDDANIPLRLFNNRTIAFGSITNALVAGCYFAILTFMSVWFQAVQGSSAIRAGVQTLPFISAAIFFTMAAGIFTTFRPSRCFLMHRLILSQVRGYYIPPMVLGFVCGAVGSGLLFTLDQNSGQAKWVGYQFLAGIIGASFQLTFVASQTVHKVGSDRERGGSIVIFCQTLGGCLFAGAAQVIYSNKFTQAVDQIPGIDAAKIASSGATAFRDAGLTADQVNAVAAAAVDSIKYSFILAAAAAALGAFTTLGMHNNDVRQQNATSAVTAKDSSEA